MDTVRPPVKHNYTGRNHRFVMKVIISGESMISPDQSGFRECVSKLYVNYHILVLQKFFRKGKNEKIGQISRAGLVSQWASFSNLYNSLISDPKESHRKQGKPLSTRYHGRSFLSISRYHLIN